MLSGADAADSKRFRGLGALGSRPDIDYDARRAIGVFGLVGVGLRSGLDPVADR